MLGPSCFSNTDYTPPQVSANRSPPAVHTLSSGSCPVRRSNPADPPSPRISCPDVPVPADHTSSRVGCPESTRLPMVMEDGTVVLGECTNTQRWTKRYRTPRRLFQWIATQAKMATYVTLQHLRTGGGPTDPLQEFRSRIRARLAIEFAYYRFVNNVDSFSDFWCFNNVLCFISNDKLFVNI